MSVEPNPATACVIDLLDLTTDQVGARLLGDVDEHDRLWTEAERELPPARIWLGLFVRPANGTASHARHR